MRRLLGLFLAIILGCSGGGPKEAVVASTGRKAEDRPFTVDVLDVGQGDSILLTSPDGQHVLIDAGTGDQGEAALPYLQKMGITALDLVIATHPHSDHIGGMDEVLEAVAVKNYTDNGLPHTTSTYSKVMKLVESKHIAYKAALYGQTWKFDHGLLLTVLNPDGAPLTGTRSDLNANSVVVRATYGSACFLFTGDSEAETEAKMLGRGIQPCDVLKVAHHGSGYSNGEAWLQAVKPRVALISVGVGNSYGHPDHDALDRLAHVGARVFRTDQGGTIHVESDGASVSVTQGKETPFSITTGGAPVASTPLAAATAPTAADDRLDLNKANSEQLMDLPGVGEKLATAILDYRKKHGRFGDVGELDRVPGIGKATLEKLRPLVTVR